MICASTAYGTLDEVNAAIGLARLDTGKHARLDAMLGRIQNDLFDVEAELCLSEKGPGGARMTVTDAQVELARTADRRTQCRPAAAYAPSCCPAARRPPPILHLARTICRRGERLMVELRDREPANDGATALKYVNRLSDFLFVASRYVNDMGARDVLWEPGANR